MFGSINILIAEVYYILKGTRYEETQYDIILLPIDQYQPKELLFYCFFNGQKFYSSSYLRCDVCTLLSI